MSTHDKMQRPHYEGNDISFPTIVRVVVVFVVITAILYVAVWWLFRYLRAEDQRRDVRRTLVEAQPPIPPEPRLEVDPLADFQEYARQQRETLDSYGWVSRAEGRVHIPIDRAMDLVIEREKR